MKVHPREPDRRKEGWPKDLAVGDHRGGVALEGGNLVDERRIGRASGGQDRKPEFPGPRRDGARVERAAALAWGIRARDDGGNLVGR